MIYEEISLMIEKFRTIKKLKETQNIKKIIEVRNKR
jgi:hypothetical protein